MITLNNFLIHRHPTCYIDGTIDFDNYTYDLRFTKKIGKYAYNMYIELWNGIPGHGGTKIKQLIYYNGRSLANKTNAPANSVSSNGTFNITKSGIYYLVMSCEQCVNSGHADNCSIYDNTENNSISCLTTEGNKNYCGAAFQLQTVTLSESGEAIIYASTTGRTITATASYSNSSNSYWAANINDKTYSDIKNKKLYIWLNNDIANARLVSNGDSTTFTGLSSNTKYMINCGCCENNGNYCSDICTLTTYKTTVDINSYTYTTATATISINNSFDGPVEWWSSINTSKRLASNGDIITETTISPGQSITIYAQPSGMNDAVGSAVVTTSTITQLNDIDAYITGTTCTLTPQFVVGDEGEVPWRASLASQIVSGVGSEPAKFDMLANGELYTIKFKRLFNENTNNELNDMATEISYDIKTYACTLQERECGSNKFIASIFQTRAAIGLENKSLTAMPYHQYDAYCVLRSGNVPGENHIGYCNITSETCTVTGLQPNTSYRLYVLLTDCKDFTDRYDSIGYIDFTTKPSLEVGAFSAKVTGKTITVTPYILKWNGSSRLNYSCYFHDDNINGPILATKNNTCTVTSINSVTATELQNGKRYYIEINAQDENGNQISINDIEVTTYGIIANIGIPRSTYLEDIELKYIDGKRFNEISQDTSRSSNIKWYITPKNETGIVDGVNSLSCRESNPIKLSTNKFLSPEIEYTFYAYIDGVSYNGNNDTVVSFDFETITCASNLRVTTYATGETICVTPSWDMPDNNNYELQVTCVISLNGAVKGTKTTKINGDALWFTDLERGKTYTISYSGIDNENNTSSDYITYADQEAGGTALETTYKLTISDFIYSTKSFKWTCLCNRALSENQTIECYLSQPDTIIYNWDKTMMPGSSVSYSSLKHNTQTTLMVRIKDMKDHTGKHDTVEIIRQYTKRLTVSLIEYKAHVRIIDTVWQAMANADPYNKDSISGDDIEFIDEMCTCEAVLKNSRTGTNDGIYANDRTRYFRGLSESKEYLIKIGITDGINIAQSSIYTIRSLMPLIRIYDAEAHRFRLALPYIYHDGNWHKAPLYVYHNNKWCDTNPEYD